MRGSSSEKMGRGDLNERDFERKDQELQVANKEVFAYMLFSYLYFIYNIIYMSIHTHTHTHTHTYVHMQTVNGQLVKTQQKLKEVRPNFANLNT